MLLERIICVVLHGKVSYTRDNGYILMGFETKPHVFRFVHIYSHFRPEIIFIAENAFPAIFYKAACITELILKICLS